MTVFRRLLACAVVAWFLAATLPAATYYVNDASTAGDLYTIAAGAAGNTGTSASSPKNSLQGIFDTYVLQGGDRIYVDTGTYAVAAPITCAAVGSADNPIQILGVPGGNYTLLSATAGTNYCLAISGSGITVRSVSATKAVVAGFAVLGGADVSLAECIAYANTGSGFYAEKSIRLSLSGCTARNNGSAGIFFSQSSVPQVSDCTAYGNPQSLFFEESPGATVRNCLLYQSGSVTSTHVRLLRSGGVNMQFCTIYGGMTGVAFFESTSCRFRNSIVYSTGAGASCMFIDTESLQTLDCDYNDLFNASGAAVAIKDAVISGTFAEWQAVSGQDAASLSADPLFVDAAAGVFYLKSAQGHHGQTGVEGDAVSSPCIDAADPSESVGSEPQPNGNRANMGRYGQTLYASRTPTHVPRTYYVNDEKLTNDIHVTAIGNTDNTGLSPDKPMLTLADVLARYQIGAGDTIYVDTGEYKLEAAVSVVATMSGSAETPLRIVGSTRGTVFTATSDMPYAFVLSGAAHVAVKNITCTGAAIGGFHVEHSTDILLEGCRSQANSYGGIHLTGSSDVTILNALVWGNAAAGVRAEGCDGITVDRCTFYRNGREMLLVESEGLALRNSILNAGNVGGMCLSFDEASHTGYSGAYNIFYREDGAILGTWTLDRQSLAQWQTITGQELTSLEVNPLFVQPPATGVSAAAVDFHLQSLSGSYHDGLWSADAQQSPGIDAGDPSVDPSAEPEDNGDRINVGAYGGTGQASRSRNANILHAPYYSTQVPTVLACANVGTGPAAVQLLTTTGARLEWTLSAGESFRKPLTELGVPAGETGGFSLVASGAGASVVADAWVFDRQLPRYVPVLPARTCEQGALFAVDRNTAAPFATQLAFYNPTSATESLTVTFVPSGVGKTPVGHLLEVPSSGMTLLDVASTLTGLADGTVGSFTVSGVTGTQIAGWTDIGPYRSLPVSVSAGNATVHVPVAFASILNLFTLQNAGTSTAAATLQLPKSLARTGAPRLEDTLPPWLLTVAPMSIGAGRGSAGLGSAIAAGDNGWGGSITSANAKLIGDSYLFLSETLVFWAPLRNNANGGVTSWYESRPAEGVNTWLALSNPSTTTATSVTVEITDAALRRHSVSLAIEAGKGVITTLDAVAGAADIAATGWLRFGSTYGVIAMTWVLDEPGGRVFPVPVRVE